MRTQDLRKELYTLIRRRAITVFTVAAALCTGLAATDWASALYILTGTDDSAILLEEGAEAPDFSSQIVSVSSGRRGCEINLNDGLYVTVRHGDTVQTVNSRRETVTRLLSRLRITPGPLETVYVNASGGGVEITVASDIIYYERVTEAAPCETVRVANPDMEAGQERVVQEGAGGVRTSIYEVVWSNGAQLSRQFVEELDSTAVDEIIEYGTKNPPRAEETLPSGVSVSSVSAGGDGSGVLLLDNGDSLRFTEVKNMTATAYTAGHDGVGTRTASGTMVHVGTVAVDPNVIPLGTRLYIVADGGIVYGLSVAEDTGVRGGKVDLYFNTYQECISFGRRGCQVYILE